MSKSLKEGTSFSQRGLSLNNSHSESLTNLTEAETVSIYTSETSTINNRGNGNQLVRRNNLNLQLRASAASSVVFLLVTFSIPTIVSFIFTVYLLSSSLSTAISCADRDTIIATLFPYIPESVRTLLTETIIHEWMTEAPKESNFFNEWRFLMIYFIPGLTREQRETLIRQLPRRRQEMLLQPGGIAQFLSLPPYLMNNHSSRQQSIILPPSLVDSSTNYGSSSRQLPRNESLTNMSTGGTALPENINSNDDNDLVWDSETVNSSNSIDDESSSEENRSLDWLQDESVIYQAIQEAIQSFSTAATRSIQDMVAIPTRFLVAHPIFSRILNTSRNLFIGTALSTGFYYTTPFFSNFVNNQMLPRLAQASRIPARAITTGTSQIVSRMNSFNTTRQNNNHSSYMGPVLISSSAFMGVSTGVLYYARYRLAESTSDSGADSEDERKKGKRGSYKN